MGLFRKKSHTAAPARPATQPPAGKQPKPGKPPKPPKAAKPGKAPKPAKPEKGLVRGVVDPADFIALRFEMVDLRARLEASEQSKAIVETRLAALDAGNAMARPPHDLAEVGVDGEVRHRIADFEAQLGAVVAAAAAASATAENAAAKAMAAAAALANSPEPAPSTGALRSVFAPAVAPLAVPTGPVSPDPTLVARIDALTAMVDAQHAARPDPTLGARVDELMSRIDAAPDANRLVELEARIDAAPDATRLGEIEALIGDLAAKIAEPAPLPLLTLGATTGTDPETTARLDDISERVGTIDSLAGQLAQLNARVSAQAEVGAQLSSLSDRISELSNGAQHLPPPVLSAPVDDGLRDDVKELTYRVEVLAERIESSESRARQTAEQLVAIEHRISAVSTELTNQVSELGRDIDGFGAYTSSNGNGHASNGNGNGNANGNGHASNGNGHVQINAELLTELQAAQIKLAAEQARYEIAFRQDLATLAEHVRRTKS